MGSVLGLARAAPPCRPVQQPTDPLLPQVPALPPFPLPPQYDVTPPAPAPGGLTPVPPGYKQLLPALPVGSLPVDRVFAKGRLDLLTSRAWMLGNPPDLVKQIVDLSVATGGRLCV